MRFRVTVLMVASILSVLIFRFQEIGSNQDRGAFLSPDYQINIHVLDEGGVLLVPSSIKVAIRNGDTVVIEQKAETGGLVESPLKGDDILKKVWIIGRKSIRGQGVDIVEGFTSPKSVSLEVICEIFEEFVDEQ